MKINENVKAFIFIVLLGISCLFIQYMVNVGQVTGHETMHKVTNSYHGVISHIEYNNFNLSGITIPDSNFLSPEDQRAAYIGHSINEAIGYQLTPLFNGIMFFQIILIIIVCFGIFYLKKD